MSATEKDALSGLYGALVDEVQQLLRPALGDNKRFEASRLSQTGRRALVRAVFAFVEGQAYALKQFALDVLGDLLSPAERAVCREESYELADNGSVLVRSMRLRFLQNIRFALTIIPKASNTTFELDVGGAGWRGLRDSLSVRDRLMHPKSAADLEVSDADLDNTMAAFSWMQRETVRLFVDVIKTAWARAGHPDGPGSKKGPSNEEL
ncbi:MAG TPA: hypothetical protein VMH34_08490 [Gammaproteobacteria bacterium]|nr:hypothetical protein [Gammaproteobacteria bacterium]